MNDAGPSIACRALPGSVFRPRQWLQGFAFDLLFDAKVKVPVSVVGVAPRLKPKPFPYAAAVQHHCE